MAESYDDLKELLKYSVEALGDVQKAVEYYVDLSTFSGAAADSLKYYLADVHLNVIVTLELILSDMLVKIGGGIEGYLGKVDSKKSSVISTEHIKSVISGFEDVSSDLRTVNREVNDVLDGVKDIFSTDSSYNTTAKRITDGIKDCNTMMYNVSKDLNTYNNDHKTDCRELLTTIGQVKKIIEGAYTAFSKGNINYNRDDAAFRDALSQIKAYDGKEFDQLYEKPDNLPGDVMEKLGKGLQVYSFGTWCDTAGISAADAIKLRQYGLKLVYKKGILKITSKTKSAEEIKDILKTFGFKHMTNSKMNKLLGKGLAMEKFKNSKLVSEMGKTKGFRWGGVEEAGKGLDDVSKLNK